MNDVFVRLLDFPCTDMKGAVRMDEDGNYNVYLNAKYTKEQQEITLLHEMAHIECGHLGSDRPIDEIEAEARERAQSLIRTLRPKR